MKIRSISVQGLFNEFDYEISLFPELTFIHSPNGYGKSTLMHLVYSVFKGDIEFMKETPFKRLDISFVDDSVLIIENIGNKFLMQMQKNNVKSPVTLEEIEKICDVTFVPPDRLTIRKKDGHLVNSLEYIAQELYETIRRTKDDKELQPPVEKERLDRSDSELEFWCKDLKAKLDFMADSGFEITMPSGLRFPPARYDLIENRERYEKLAYSVSDYIDRNYQLAESIIVFKDIVNNIFINKTIEVNESGKLMIMMNNGTTLPLSKLSSGETQILLIFYMILFHSSNDGIVIVDEPENSLHVSWQQTLGDYFRDICRVRKVQMLVATHSPQVIHDKWDFAEEMVLKNA